jgi:putative oxidoreductase
MKQYHIVSRIAIYLLSVVMISFGIFHFLNARDLVVYIPSSVPGGIVWVNFVGAAFILVGIAFITNRLVKTAAYLLAFLLFIFIVIIHIPNYLEAGDKAMRSMALINILKDTAIAGFALHIAAGAHHQKLHVEESD